MHEWHVALTKPPPVVGHARFIQSMPYASMQFLLAVYKADETGSGQARCFHMLKRTWLRFLSSDVGRRAF